MAECSTSPGDADEGPPPLEDMTEHLKRVKLGATKLQPSLHPLEDSTVPPSISKSGSIHREDKKRQAKEKAGETGSGFGGFKKGFLFSSKSSSSSPASTKNNCVHLKSKDETSSEKLDSTTSLHATTKPPKDQGTLEAVDDVIRPKQQDSKSSGLEFPEVQQAMKNSFPFLNTEDWVTDDLLAKIENDSILSKAFKDPEMTQALAQFQDNPEHTLAAATDKPEIQKFLQSFCALMGEHFTALEDAKKEKAEVPVSEIVSQDEAQMKEILSKPEVRKVLDDPVIMTLLETLKINPNAAQQLFRSGSPHLKQKIKILIDHGLLAVQ